MEKTAKHFLKDAIDHYEAGRYEEALVVCNSAIELDPLLARAYHGRGLSLKWQDRYQEALESYQKSLALFPENAKAYADMGELLFILNEYEKSGLSFRRAIQLNKKFEIAYKSNTDELVYYAFHLDNSGLSRSEAIDAFEKAALFNPSDDRIKYYLSCLQITKAPYVFTPGRTTTYDPAPPGPSSSHPYSCSCYACVHGTYLGGGSFSTYSEYEDDD